MRRTIVLLTCFFLWIAARSQFSAGREKAIVLKRMIELNHYSPRLVDDSFSLAVFKKLINTADRRRLLFTAAEYKQLSAYNLLLDDELQGKAWAFADLFTSLYKNALLRADSIVNKVLQKPFDFSTDETVTYQREEHFNFANDRPALENRWSRYLKFTMLNQVYEAAHGDSSKTVSLQTAMTSLEPRVREKIKQAEIKLLKKNTEYPGGPTTFFSELYLNAVSTCFDPHTNYFSPQGKENFQSLLSTEAYSFGLELDENEKGQIVIEHLTPGGPAWRSGELHKGDELLSLQWEGKETVEIAGVDIEEIYSVLEESVHERLVFKFRRADGTIQVVFLRKEKIDNEENIVKGFVLKGERKIGYILLPGFYTEWGNESGSSCANDVAKEIVKLKKENIEGLILDVRFNGGGSLEEAMQLTGIFIDEGPLATTKTGDGKLTTLRDPNRGIIYDGPLALMVNGQSASASEMLAASLQDYNRALIIGSNTFGKATMQQLLQLDTVRTRAFTGTGEKDMVKITMGKLYRLNGKSAQLNGVAPDILLPDAFSGLNIGERSQLHALPSDTARKNPYYKPLQPLPVSELSKRSTERTTARSEFQNIKKVVTAQQKTRQLASQVIPLKWDGFEKWRQAQELELEIMDGETAATTKFIVDNHSQDKQWIQQNQYAKEMNEVWLHNLAADIYIEETFLVLADLIKLQKANR